MQKFVLTLCLCTLSTIVLAQDSTKKAKDTIIKTEVINVVTSYTPTISDAFKIKKNPTIQLGQKYKRSN